MIQTSYNPKTLLRGMSLLVFITLIGYSCSSKKFLKDTECLVKKNNFIFEDIVETKEAKTLESVLQPYILLKPNDEKLLFFIPRDYLYMLYDQKGWKTFRNTFGSLPSIYNDELADQSTDNVKNFLVNNQGYFNANVSHAHTRSEKNCEVTYTIQTGGRYKINSITYISVDTTLLNVLFDDSINQVIKVDEFISGSSFNLEKNRISNFLQNRGYANFSAQYIDIKGDSSNLDFKIDIFIEIYPPSNQLEHTQYINGKINVYTDYYNKQDTFFLDEVYIDDIRYLKESNKWVVSPKELNKYILIKQGSPSSKNDRVLTYRKMTNLGAYRFVSLNTSLDLEDSTKINYDLQLIPHNTIWTSDYGADLYYSTSPQFKNLIGGVVNGRLINKNIFKGSEQYSLSANINSEVNFNSKNFNNERAFLIARTFGFGVNNDLSFPRIINYLGFPNLMTKAGVLQKNSNGKYLSEATSNYNIGLNVQYILDFYSVSSYNANFGYKVQNGTKSSLNINTLGVVYNDYSRGRLFDSIPTADILKLSFVDNFFTSFIFNKFLHIKNSTSSNGLLSGSRILGLEVSGLEIYVLNKMYNLAASEPLDVYWKLLGSNFEFSKFIRADAERRFSYKLNNGSSLAFRGVAGIIVPFGDTRISPFIRQYNVGGPNSLRGWLPRQLVGGYVQENNNRLLFANQGDIRLEANAEYRFTLGGLVKGGLFVDAGNTWLLKENGFENTAFTSQFYNQIAIAAGYGVRLDFDYFLLRFDFGYKLRNP
ncbi:MAG TPA: BamA/TamA family outer membrane protein, partial [Saprospiraceae bacterium]|nr:BamA/TamA family outer membrane protein [Saprospiraceae bacterium]